MRVHVPVSQIRGSRQDGRWMFTSFLTGMAAVGGRPWLGEVGKGTGRARYVRAYVKYWTLNSAIEQELCDRRVEDRANAKQGLLSGGSVLVNPSIQKIRTKFIEREKLISSPIPFPNGKACDQKR